MEGKESKDSNDSNEGEEAFRVEMVACRVRKVQALLEFRLSLPHIPHVGRLRSYSDRCKIEYGGMLPKANKRIMLCRLIMVSVSLGRHSLLCRLIRTIRYKVSRLHVHSRLNDAYKSRLGSLQHSSMTPPFR